MNITLSEQEYLTLLRIKNDGEIPLCNIAATATAAGVTQDMVKNFIVKYSSYVKMYGLKEKG